MDKPAMERMIRLHANRMLRPRELSSGAKRGLSNYFSFEHGARPAWWHDDMLEPQGQILGILELRAGRSENAIVFTTQELVSLGEVRTRVAYECIFKFDQFEKEPMSEELIVHLRDGGEARIPVPGRTGVIASVLSFGIYALREAKKMRGEFVQGGDQGRD